VLGFSIQQITINNRFTKFLEAEKSVDTRSAFSLDEVQCYHELMNLMNKSHGLVTLMHYSLCYSADASLIGASQFQSVNDNISCFISYDSVYATILN